MALLLVCYRPELGYVLVQKLVEISTTLCPTVTLMEARRRGQDRDKDIATVRVKGGGWQVVPATFTQAKDAEA